MTNITDTQAKLLTNAAEHTCGSLLPLPQSIAPSGGINRSIAALVRAGLLEERQANEAAEEGHDLELSPALFITAAGRIAAGAVGQGAQEQDAVPASAAPARLATQADAAASSQAGQRKSAGVIALLRRQFGATMPELLEATGWLPHSARAALSMLRKKGHSIERTKQGATSCYRILG